MRVTYNESFAIQLWTMDEIPEHMLFTRKQRAGLCSSGRCPAPAVVARWSKQGNLWLICRAHAEAIGIDIPLTHPEENQK